MVYFAKSIVKGGGEAPAVPLMAVPWTVVRGCSPVVHWVSLMSHSGAVLEPLAAEKSSVRLPVMVAVLKTQKSWSLASDKAPVIQAFSTGRFWSEVALAMASSLLPLSPVLSMVLSTVARML